MAPGEASQTVCSMDDLRKEKKYGYIGRTAILTAVAAALAILPALIIGRGMLLLSDDFNWQQQIFNIYNASLARTPAAWSWVIDLGSNPATALSFYNLNSPYTLILAIFPASVIPYLTAPMLVLKYVIGAVGAAVFARKFVKGQGAAVLCGLLYAFAGIQTVSLLFPFHDSMSLFPWLLVALEKLLEGRPLVFAFAVAVSAMTNFYIFFGEVIFLLIWFVFRVLLMKNTAKSKLIAFGKTLLEGVIGVAAAGLVLVPSFLAVTSNPRVGSQDFSLLYHFTQYVTLLQAYFMPADVMGMKNYLFQKGCSSCSLSLPFLAMALVFTYVKKNFKKPQAYLPVTLVIISLVPLLNGAFSFFNEHYYARWFFMPALVFAMLSCVVLDRYAEDVPGEASQEGADEKFTKKDIVFGAKMNLVCVVLTMLVETLAILWYKLRGVTSLIADVDIAMLIVYGVFGQLCAFGVLAAAAKAGPGRFAKITTACVLAAGILTTGTAAVRYSVGTDVKEYYEPEILNSEGEIGAEKAKAIITASGGLADVLPADKNYRVRNDWHEEGESYFAASFDNVSMLTGIPSVNSFISTVEGGLFTFYDLTGNTRNVATTGTFSEEQMALLSARFYLTPNPGGGPDGGTKYGEYEYPDGSVIYIYEYENFVPLGFLYTKYITPDELRTLPGEERALAMLSYAVLDENDAEAIKEAGISLSHGDPKDVLDFASAVKERKETGAKAFETSDSGFEAYYENSASGVAFVSTAYSEGFRFTVNGREVKAYSSAGLLAIPLEAGANHITAVYTDPGETPGMILTGCAVVAGSAEAIVFVLLEMKKRRKAQEQKAAASKAEKSEEDEEKRTVTGA